MDQLPVEINQRIRHEARVAGMREARAPSIEMVEKRRMQLWFLTFIVIVVLGLASLAASWRSGSSIFEGEPWILRGAVAALGLGFCLYAAEKEIHLHRLSRLLVDERVLNSAMSHRLQMNAALFNAGKALNSVLDLDDVLDAILANALDLLGGATGSVMLVEDEESLRVVAVRGSRLGRDAKVKLGESIAGRVARSREPLLIAGVVGPGDYPGYADREHTTSSAMCVPLVNRGQLLGVLNISASSERDFDEHDLQVLSLFAEPVAAAIREKAGLYEAERAHVAQLLDTDRMKTQFVASVSHELRTPITSIRGAVSASRRSITPEQRVELLEVIERQSLRLQAMVEEIFTAAKMEEDGNRPLLRRIDLAALVRLAALDSQVAGRPVEVEAPAACEVRADPEAVRRIVGNLIENAHKYGEAPVRITVQPTEEQVVLSVVDHGAGVPAEVREKVFERFYRADPNGTKPGMGLGLAIVRGLVESCGGSVWVEDAAGGGAAFRVALRTGATEEIAREVAHVG